MSCDPIKPVSAHLDSLPTWAAAEQLLALEKLVNPKLNSVFGVIGGEWWYRLTFNYIDGAGDITGSICIGRAPAARPDSCFPSLRIGSSLFLMAKTLGWGRIAASTTAGTSELHGLFGFCVGSVYAEPSTRCSDERSRHSSSNRNYCAFGGYGWRELPVAPFLNRSKEIR